MSNINACIKISRVFRQQRNCWRTWNYKCRNLFLCCFWKYIFDSRVIIFDASVNNMCNNNLATRNCKDDEHKCGNGRCIKKNWFCDNYADCKDESDESPLRCSKCNFTCINNIVLKHVLVQGKVTQHVMYFNCAVIVITTCFNLYDMYFFYNLRFHNL